MAHPENINIWDYTYELPDNKIALNPLTNREDSKLLVYTNGDCIDDTFKNIDKYISSGTLLVFNNTKVINARLLFPKRSGGIIEIFCLEPAEKGIDFADSLNKKNSSIWKCFVGGAAKWKTGTLEKNIQFKDKEVIVTALLIEKVNDIYFIELSWKPGDTTLLEILKEAGNIPLPPYIKRAPVIDDTTRYQTIYAEKNGSVAAPTAGLHFTDTIFHKLSDKNIIKEFVTLHVGAGTFKPVKANKLLEHEMHAEWLDVSNESIKNLSLATGEIIAVGTTSLRTLETLYWLGVKIFLDPVIKGLHLSQWEVYEEPLKSAVISRQEALFSLLKWMEVNHHNNIVAQTQLLIAPGYNFKMVNALITNFHQPQSTLLLLVAAAIGEEWKKIYDHALQNDYRFLSYGDGMMIRMT